MKRKAAYFIFLACFFMVYSLSVSYAVEKNGSDDRWEIMMQGIEPMYAGLEMGSSEKEMDETLLKYRIKEEGSKEAVVAVIIKSAWNYYHSGYPNIAMRKFNQVWLLDPNNAELYFGFGSILRDRKQFAEAAGMLLKAVDLNPRYSKAYADFLKSLKEASVREK